MKKSAYTKEQHILILYVKKRIRALFKQFPVPAHNADHSERTAWFAAILARKEKARSLFLCELAALLHDIGRVTEKYTKGETRSHQELSYILLRQWFREDRAFDILSKKEKLELLYAVRYHWNSMAMTYDTAWILRDADRLDLMGMRGIRRAIEHKPECVDQFLRNIHDILFWMHTDTARKYIKEKKLLEPMMKYYRKRLKRKIEEVEL